MNTKLLSAGATILLVFGALIGINSHYTVKTGETAIISKFGKISDVKYDGLHFKVPFITSKDIMTIRNTTYDFNKVEVSTKDMQTITLDLKMQVEISNPEIVYRNFRNNYVNAYIIPVAYEKAIERTKIAEQDKITAQKEYDKQLEIAKKKKEIAKALKEEKEIVIKTMEMEANTLNDKVLKKMFIEKWDGKLPTTMAESEIVKMVK